MLISFHCFRLTLWELLHKRIMLEILQRSLKRMMLLIMLMVAVTWAKSDYCRISPKHTMCRYKGVSPSCHQHTEREGHFNLLTPPQKKDSRTLWFFSRILKMLNWSVLLEVWVKQIKRRFWNITTGLYLVTTVSSIWLIAMSLLPFQVVVYKVLWKLDMNLEAFAARLCLIGLHFYVV